ILKELNGADVNLTKFLAGGFDYTNQIASWFGSTRLPASGTLQASLCWALDSTPVTLSYEMDGVDGSGRAVQATLQVRFWSFDDKSGDAPEAAARSVAPALTNEALNAPQEKPRGMIAPVPRLRERVVPPLGLK